MAIHMRHFDKNDKRIDRKTANEEENTRRKKHRMELGQSMRAQHIPFN